MTEPGRPPRTSLQNRLLRTVVRALQGGGLLVNDLLRGLTDVMSSLSRVSMEAPTAFIRAFAALLYTLLRGLDLSVFGVLLRSLAIAPVERRSPRQRTLSEAIDALQSASSFVQELENDLQARTQQLRELQTRYDRLEELTAVEQEKARVILGEVEATVGKGRRREYVVAFLINAAVAALFFVIGLWVGT